MNFEFVLFFIFGIFVTGLPVVAYIVFKVAILKVILDGLRKFISSSDDGYY